MAPEDIQHLINSVPRDASGEVTITQWGHDYISPLSGQKHLVRNVDRNEAERDLRQLRENRRITTGELRRREVTVKVSEWK